MNQAPQIRIPLFTYFNMLRHDPIGLRTKIFKEYGDIAWYKLKGMKTYHLAHPDYIKHVLQDNEKNYLFKHPVLEQVFSPLIGTNNLFTTNDLSQWHKDRTITNVSFEPKVYFEDYVSKISNLTMNMFKRWEDTYKNGEYIDINAEIGALVIAIFLRTIFNDPFDENYLYSLINSASNLIKKKVSTLSIAWYFSRSKKEYENVISETKKITTEIVKNKLASPYRWDDLLGNMIHDHKDDSKEKIIDSISYHFAAFMAVGYFTTSALISWVLVELSRYPEIEKNIAQEVNRKLSGKLPTFDDLKALPYLSSVIKETLRLHPTSFVAMRQAIESDVLQGFSIPKHAGIAISTYHVHRHPDFWINPEGFDPDRFHNNPLGQSHPFAYIPFSWGKRRCPGSGFSTLEVTIIIALLVQRFRLYLPPHQEVKPSLTTVISMRPSIDKMRLIFKN